MSEVFSLKGETALITGGGSGLGLAIAKCMATAGARVVLVGRREPELRAAADVIGAHAGFLVHDITRCEEAGAFVKRAVSVFERPISILVNNAGIHLKKPAVETSAEEFSSVLQTHIIAAHALTSEVLPGMIQRRHGNILFTASMASLFGIPKVVAYSAAKSAMLGIVRTLATEVSADGVRVNAIAPGWIETEMSRRAMEGDPARKQKILSRTPMNAFGHPDDVGWAAVYLASPAARFVTGAVLPVDGGASIGF